MFFFFFNDTATTEIYTLSLHDALPICLSRGESFCHSLRYLVRRRGMQRAAVSDRIDDGWLSVRRIRLSKRSEEHTSELQSQSNLVCRLLLEKKKTFQTSMPHPALLSRR